MDKKKQKVILNAIRTIEKKDIPYLILTLLVASFFSLDVVLSQNMIWTYGIEIEANPITRQIYSTYPNAIGIFHFVLSINLIFFWVVYKYLPILSYIIMTLNLVTFMFTVFWNFLVWWDFYEIRREKDYKHQSELRCERSGNSL